MIMLETSQERVKLLKKGLSKREIECLYIHENKFIFISMTYSHFIELIEIDV